MNTVRAGVVGTGWGQLQLEAFRRVRGVRVEALCDADAARLHECGQRYRIRRLYSHVADLIADESVDWVGIAAPPAAHQAMVQAAIAAGKHILCEKPAALTEQAIADLLVAARARPCVHAVNYQMRYLPALAYAKELIDEDYIGALHRVDVSMTMAQPWGELGHWAAQEELGGGVLRELGSHFIDILRWWFGDVTTVLAETRTHFALRRVPGVTGDGNSRPVLTRVTGDDAFWCVLQFARGGEAVVNFLTGARHEPGWSIGAYGSTATLLARSGQLLAMREGDREMDLMPIPKRLELPQSPADPLTGATARLVENVLARINGLAGAGGFPDLADDLAVARIVAAIRRSSSTRAWTTVG